jgi:hypothetical protein
VCSLTWKLASSAKHRNIAFAQVCAFLSSFRLSGEQKAQSAISPGFANNPDIPGSVSMISRGLNCSYEPHLDGWICGRRLNLFCVEIRNYIPDFVELREDCLHGFLDPEIDGNVSTLTLLNSNG